MIKSQKFGEYLLSLSPTERAFSGRRVKVISKFIEEDVELSKPGYQEYLSKFGMDLNDTDRKYLCDFLYFSGVRRLGGARKPKGKVAEKIATITEVNMKMVCAFLEWAKNKGIIR